LRPEKCNMDKLRLTDIDLFKLIQQDDEEAFAVFFRRHWESLYKLVLHKTGDTLAAQDMIQEIFVHLWEKRHSIKVSTTLAQYLSGVVRNQVFDFYRQSKKQSAQLVQLGQWIEATVDTSPQHDTIRERQSMEEIFDRAVEQLPTRMREIYLLRTRDRLSYEHIATQLQIKPQTARNAFSRAVTLLAEHTGNTATILYLLFLL
jgi:RNA polymerase sigma factor (sigma-70 family)